MITILSNLETKSCRLPVTAQEELIRIRKRLTKNSVHSDFEGNLQDVIVKYIHQVHSKLDESGIPGDDAKLDLEADSQLAVTDNS